MLLQSLAAAALAVAGVAGASAEDHGKLPWFEGTYEELMAKALDEDKLVFVDFWTNWCGWSERLNRDTFSDDGVVAAMEGMLCFRIDAESRDGAPLARRYGVRRYPALLFVEPDGTLRDRIAEDFLPAEPFIAEVGRIRRDDDTLTSLRAAVAAKPDDMALRYRYAVKLRDVDDHAGFAAQMVLIKQFDPKGETPVGRQIQFDELYGAVQTSLQRVTERPVEPLEAFLVDEQSPERLHLGWSLVGMVYDVDARGLKEAGREEEARAMSIKCRAAYSKAWPHTPEAVVETFGNQLAWAFWLGRDQLSDAEKTLALEAARKAAKVAVDQSSVLDTLACCYFMNGQNAKALETVERCAELDPTNPLWEERRVEFAVGGD
jgi:thiol-disulfide isomerase/thioredoxin